MPNTTVRVEFKPLYPVGGNNQPVQRMYVFAYRRKKGAKKRSGKLIRMAHVAVDAASHVGTIDFPTPSGNSDSKIILKIAGVWEKRVLVSFTSQHRVKP